MGETQMDQHHLKSWEEILLEQCHPTLRLGIKGVYQMIETRRKHSRKRDNGNSQQLAIMLDFLGEGQTKAGHYKQLAEAALMALNPTSVDHADEILREAVCLLIRKNHDYGASVFSSGPLTPDLPPETAALVRLGDKYNRLLTLADKEAMVAESTRDTIFDVLGYSIILLGMAKAETGVIP
jgi:hypothetical protein